MDTPTSSPFPRSPSRRRLLIVSSVRWGYLWQRHQALACAAAADGWSVDFLEPSPRRGRQVARYLLERLRGGRPLSRPTTPPPSVRVLAPREWLRRGADDYDLVLCYLPSWSAVRRARRSSTAIVYDAVLDWARVPPSWYPPRGWRRAERRLARTATAVTTDSAGTQDVLAARGIPSEVVLPAADPAFLRRSSIPPSPGTAVYFGAVRDEVDDEAIASVAASGLSVTVVGPVERAAVVARLRAAGVALRDALPVDDLAEVVARHQYVLLPYRGARGASLMPAKIWNCIASGRWVLTSGFEPPVETPAVIRIRPNGWSQAADAGRPLVPPEVPHAPTWAERWQQIREAAGLTEV